MLGLRRWGSGFRVGVGAYSGFPYFGKCPNLKTHSFDPSLHEEVERTRLEGLRFRVYSIAIQNP